MPFWHPARIAHKFIWQEHGQEGNEGVIKILALNYLKNKNAKSFFSAQQA
jgi:hypothetical protein